MRAGVAAIQARAKALDSPAAPERVLHQGFFEGPVFREDLDVGAEPTSGGILGDVGQRGRRGAKEARFKKEDRGLFAING